MTFYLYRSKVGPLKGRVVIDDVLPVGISPISVLEAADWGKARNQVSELAYEYRPGYGYF